MYLDMFRHSLKDGPNNTIGPDGADLAMRQGEIWRDNYTDIFVGILPRTRQTAEHFFAGGKKPMPEPIVIEEFGSDALFAEMVNDKFKEAIKDGKSNFDALRAAHPDEQVRAWAEIALQGIKKCVENVSDFEVIVVGFGHSPIIELAYWATTGFSEDLDPFFTNLSEIEALIFDFKDDQIINMVDKICRPDHH